MIGAIHRRAALLSGAEIVGVMASSPTRSREVAALWGVEAITDLDALASLLPDVVHICTPNASHASLVEAAIASGAHVICEKPLSLNVATTDRLTRLAAAHQRVATVPFVYRFHPLVREIRARAAAGDFGRWQVLHGSYLQDWLLSPTSTSWRVESRLGGASRAFADIGSHWCDLLEFVTGERIAAVSAAMSTTVPVRPDTTGQGSAETDPARLVEVDTEDVASVTFRTTTGVLGSVLVSQVSAGRKNRLWFEFDGELQSAVFDQENPETAWLGDPHGARVLVRDPSTGSAGLRRPSTLPAGHAQGYAQCFEDFVADTYAAVRGEQVDGLPTFQDGLRSAQVVDAVIRSAADAGRWVKVTGPTATDIAGIR